MEKHLKEAIQKHIRDCKAAVDEAVFYASFDVRHRIEELELAKKMEQDPSLFFEHQRVAYLNSSI